MIIAIAVVVMRIVAIVVAKILAEIFVITVPFMMLFSSDLFTVLVLLAE